MSSGYQYHMRHLILYILKWYSTTEVRVYSPFFFRICLNSKSENGFSVLPLLEITDPCWHQIHGNKQVVLLNDKMKPSKFNWNEYVLRRHVKYRSSCNIKNLFRVWTKLATGCLKFKLYGKLVHIIHLHKKSNMHLQCKC